MNEEFTNMDNDEIRTEYKREDLGKGVRGKYFARFTKASRINNMTNFFSSVAGPSNSSHHENGQA